ncbi:hypothetical protein HDV03_000082 [Kappamyces sp. JEL0829]|nr:hypothetical protein HDV03_000082 [Kappamyces sp. JEL0829]
MAYQLKKITLLPLPGATSFLNGKYGIELCLVQGLIRIHFDDKVNISLSLSLSGLLHSQFWDSLNQFDTVSRKKILFDQKLELLSNVELEPGQGWIDIPFEIPVPLHDPITHGFGPCSQLLPNTCQVFGKNGYHSFRGETYYLLSCFVSTPSSIPWMHSTVKQELKIQPFPIWDPRLIPILLNPEERRWKSHIGAAPLEYDIEISNGVFGPGDTINFGYRMLVNGDHARRGVRIKQISFVLKETTIVGEDRCCARDDLDGATWRHGRPMRVRGAREILRWSQQEYPPPNNPNPWASTLDAYGRGRQKYDGLGIPDRVFPGSDGIYVERSAKITIPGTGDFNPTTARPVIPADDHICKFTRPRDGFIQIRHSIVVTIELKASDTISIEAGCYLSGLGKADIQKMLDEDPEVMPTLDYNKVVGIECWVPEYTETQEVDPSDLPSASEATDTKSLHSCLEDGERGCAASSFGQSSMAESSNDDGEQYQDACSRVGEPSHSSGPTPYGTPRRSLQSIEIPIPASPPPDYAFDDTARVVDPDLEPVLKTLTELSERQDSLLDLNQSTELLRDIHPTNPPRASQDSTLNLALAEAMDESLFF